MGLFDFGKDKKAIKELSEQLHQLKQLTTSFDNNVQIRNLKANINQAMAVYPSWNLNDQTKTYSSVDDIYSIIRLTSTTAARIPLYGYFKTPDEKAFSKLLREQKTAYRNPNYYKSIQKKALEDLPPDDRVAILIDNPSTDLSQFEFFEAVYSFLQIDGECFLLKERTTEGVNQGMPMQLHIMPPQNVALRVTDELPRRIVGYDYHVNGKAIQERIPVDDVIHIKYFNPEMTQSGNELRGLSPLKVLKKRLVRTESNMDTSVAQLQNGGVPGIVYDKGPDQGFDADGKEVSVVGKRKQEFYKYLSNSNNKGAPYFASGDMGYIQIGMALADLSVAELANIDFKKLCNAFGVSDVLFNSSDTNSENNVFIQTKRLYTNTILPNVIRVRDAFIKGLLPDFRNGVVLTDENGEETKIPGDGKDRYIDADISGITELHEDLGKLAASMQATWWLTPNEKREMMNYERYDDPVFDQPLIPAGLQTLEDFEMIPPVE